MPLTARNHLAGTIQSIQREGLSARVVINIGQHSVEAVIPQQSADTLNILIGDEVKAVIKATDVMVIKERHPAES